MAINPTHVGMNRSLIRAAYMAVKDMTLTAEEYRRVEDMLRLRYDDQRRNAIP